MVNGGFIFDTEDDAKQFVTAGKYPKHYKKIDWHKFPGDGGIIEVGKP
jgi:hypothetical protein